MDILDALILKLDASPDNRGRWHADCPFCGAAPTSRAGGKAYHFYLYDLPQGRGAMCWACGYKGSWAMVARELAVQGDDRPATPRVQRPDPTPPWAVPGFSEGYRSYVQRPEIRQQVHRLWQAYKPLAASTIDQHLLSVAKVPRYDIERGQWEESRYARLLLPLIVGGQIVGFRGRTYLPRDTGPKWLTASASQTVLMGLEDVRPGAQVIVVENYVDRLLLMEADSRIVALASGGLTWRPEWSQALAARRPKHVLLWFDHDLSGNGSVHHHAEFLALWRAEIEQRRRDNPALVARPFPTPPEPRGPKLANELNASGIKASIYAWPRGTAHRADVGSLLIQERMAA